MLCLGEELLLVYVGMLVVVPLLADTLLPRAGWVLPRAGWVLLAPTLVSTGSELSLGCQCYKKLDKSNLIYNT